MKYVEPRIYRIAVILFMCISGIAYAQSAEDLMRSQIMQRQSSGMNQPNVDVPSINAENGAIRSSDLLPDPLELYYPEQSEILLDGNVDSSKYIVGPGDLLGIYLWGEIERDYPPGGR